MAILKLTEFAKSGAKNTDDLDLEAGFPAAQKPARQWFNWLFNSLALKINEIIDQLDQPENRIKSGMTVMWPSSTVPAGYLECAGQAVSRTTYAALFAIIGTSFGPGDGSSTFNIPDMRGEFARGWDHGRGIDTGRELGSIQLDELKAHSHAASTADAGAHVHSTKVGGDANNVRPDTPTNAITMAGNSADSGATGSGQIVEAGSHAHTVTVNSTGGTETRPRNIAWMFIIKF
jgi:microcystin-dependent protein